MPKLKFFDLRDKKSFMTDKFTTFEKGGTKFAKTTAPSGVKSVRIIGRK